MTGAGAGVMTGAGGGGGGGPPQLPKAIHAVSRSSRLVGMEAAGWINGKSSKARVLGNNMRKEVGQDVGVYEMMLKLVFRGRMYLYS